MKEFLLAVGGILNVAFAIFHLTFWWNPGVNWEEELPKLNQLNRATTQVANIIVYLLVCFAVISFLLRLSPSFRAIETAAVLLVGGFYLFRAILQLPFYGVSRISDGLFVVCLLTSGCYFGTLL
jgi:hypothetical protein